MLYLVGYTINKDDSIEIQVCDSSTNHVSILCNDQQIRNAIHKYGDILGVEVLNSTIMYAVYNKELIKLHGLSKPTKVGMKFEYRNWIEATYIPTRNENYEYTFEIGNKKVRLGREYLLMQKVKFDLSDRFKGLPRNEREYSEEEILPSGFIPKPPAPTQEELRIAARQRRIEQEEAQRERNRQIEIARRKARDEERQREREYKEQLRKEAKQRAFQQKASQVQKLLKNEKQLDSKVAQAKPTNQAKPVVQRRQPVVTKSFRPLTDQELQSRFEIVTIYKGFKICRSLDDKKDFGILCVKAKPILAKTINAYVKPGEKIVTPFETLAATKTWINNEFY